jgi:hypothetical protein
MRTKISPPAALPAEAPLAKLAKQINEAHALCEESYRAGLQHAVRTGQLLLQAKARVGHGDWLAWLKKNCRLFDRLAQKYMRVARELPKLDAANTPRVADLSFREALNLVVKNSRTVRQIPEDKRGRVLDQLAKGEAQTLTEALVKAQTHRPLVVEIPAAPHEDEALTKRKEEVRKELESDPKVRAQTEKIREMNRRADEMWEGVERLQAEYDAFCYGIRCEEYSLSCYIDAAVNARLQEEEPRPRGRRKGT